MPQLSPAPWLLIMTASWLFMLTLFNSKTASAYPQNPPMTDQQMTHKTHPWNWPWA